MPLFPARVQVVAVGKLNGRYWLPAQEDYVKRLRRYADFHLVEVKDVVGRGLPDEVAVAKEGELLQQAAGSGRLIVLTPTGTQLSSPELARFLQRQMEEHGRFSFLVGGPLGFSPGLLAAAHNQLSLSALTFPHELARIVLLEQLYRAFTILNNEKYHK